ncbi:hypothetical protein CapIbe_006702 [Capra ibex]
MDTEEELESPTKKIQMEEMTSPEKIRTFTPTQVTTMELLTDSESNLDIQAKDEKERAESPPEPRALEECSRAKTPEWLAALDSGFQCMSCYRIFPSLEDLQKHMEHGITAAAAAFGLNLKQFLASEMGFKGDPPMTQRTVSNQVPMPSEPVHLTAFSPTLELEGILESIMENQSRCLREEFTAIEEDEGNLSQWSL